MNADVLNAVDFGVPQSRRRTCIIGKFGATKVKMPEPVSKRVTIWDAISDLAYLESGEGTEEQTYRLPIQSEHSAIAE